MINKNYKKIIIDKFFVKDIRFRFFEGGPGSDANNPHTDYSNPYLEILSKTNNSGIGIGFSLGKGNEHICDAIKELFPIIKGKSLYEILSNFSKYWRALANPFQSRWIGPFSGPYYMAAGVITNAIFDLWAKIEKKPLWEVLCYLTSEETIELLDFRYVEHILSAKEALEMLKKSKEEQEKRKKMVLSEGMPCYFTTWLGTSIEDLKKQIKMVMSEKGIRDFKMKVGVDLETDIDRIREIRKEFGNSIRLYVDANQVWSPRRSVEWMKKLSKFNIEWIEEPTAPDSVSGHKYIKDNLKDLGIDVVTGENCPNSHIAAHFISSGAIDRFQIDSCRVIGPAENMLIMLIAKKYNVPICPHAGGSGLDELVPHLSAWNHIALGASFEKVVIEQVNFCSEYFLSPNKIENGRIYLPKTPGYIVGLKKEAIEKFEFPNGKIWREE